VNGDCNRFEICEICFLWLSRLSVARIIDWQLWKRKSRSGCGGVGERIIRNSLLGDSICYCSCRHKESNQPSQDCSPLAFSAPLPAHFRPFLLRPFSLSLLSCARGHDRLHWCAPLSFVIEVKKERWVNERWSREREN
jgi:hypothetical protein